MVAAAAQVGVDVRDGPAPLGGELVIDPCKYSVIHAGA